MRHQKPWWSHWAGSIFVTDNPTVTPSGSAVADQVRRGVWSSLSSSILFKKNLHNSSFQFSLESVAASRESGVISRPGSSLFSCGVERQRSAASKIERCLLSLSFWHALLELRLVIWCWKRHHISYQEFWQAHYDYLFTVFYLPGRVCVDTKCGHHWCTFCERCIMCSGDLLLPADLQSTL